MTLKRFLVATFLIGVTCSLTAATYVVPPDRVLVNRAEAIVVGTVTATYPRLAANGDIETVVEFAVEEVIKGPIGAPELQIVQFGGVMGDRWMVASGAPHFVAGERSLLFLAPHADGAWTTLDLALGRFVLGNDYRGALALRDHEAIFGWDPDGREHVERARLQRQFLEFVRAVVRGDQRPVEYWAPDAPTETEPQSENQTFQITPSFTGMQYCDVLGSNPGRRPNNAIAWRLSGNQTGLDSSAAATIGTAAWRNDSASSVSYTRSDTPATGNTKAEFDGEDRIIANDPNGIVSGTFSTGSGTIAMAFYGGGGTNTFNGELYSTITGGDIVFNDGVSAATLGQEKFNTTMTHELGHTLGFRHSNTAPGGGSCSAPLPCSSSAIMNSNVVSGFNGSLQSWDRDAVQSVYGSGPACTAPSISGQPQSTTIDTGTSTTLTVTATGTSPLAFQWYRGTKPDASNPVGSNSSSLNTGTLTTTTNFWVRVTNDCGIAESNTATVTVSAACPKPVITVQPQGTTIERDQNANLSVSATSDTTMSFQWFRGTKPDTSAPVGTNSSSFNTGALTVTSSYWVRVTNACGSTDSNTITVTVVCPKPVITVQPQSATISPGLNRNLSVTATSSTTLSYQWFRGSKPDTSNPVGSNSPNFSTGALSTTTSYWVRVSNLCGDTDSVTITITVCTFPVINVQPANQSVTIGQNASLSVTVSATSPVTFSWFEGATGNTSKPAGSGSTLVTGPLNATTSFWVRISNPCGTVDSTAAIVTVAAACTAPQISAQPGDQTVPAGSTATLSVTATGTSLLFQWFEGGLGVITKPVGINSNVLTTSALTTSTSFWVRISNACGQLDSRVASVVVQAICTAPGISLQPADQTVPAGSAATLSVTATGTSLLFQWFEGGLGVTTKPVGINSNVLTTSALTTSTSFWVRISNACGQLDSRVASVVVQSICIAPGISVQPSSTTINAGATVVLSVVATGSAPVTFRWFEGVKGDTSRPVVNGDASVLSVARLSANTRYWVRITNACGSFNSESALVTVNVLRRRGVRR